MSKKLKMIILLLIAAISAETVFSMESLEHTHEDQELELIINPTQNSGTQDIENKSIGNFMGNIYKKLISDHNIHGSILKSTQFKQTATRNISNFNNYSDKESFNHKRITEFFWQRPYSQYCY